MSLINLVFKKIKKENRPALLTYTVAGDNNKKIKSNRKKIEDYNISNDLIDKLKHKERYMFEIFKDIYEQ